MKKNQVEKEVEENGTKKKNWEKEMTKKENWLKEKKN
jgi:hypothetical protein